MAPPPRGWRPPVRLEPPPPRELPAQDHHLMDAQEQAARALTLGVTMVTGAIALVLLLIICGRALF
jgi:hypothetical protein